MRLVVVGGGFSGLATAFRIRERFEAHGRPLELRVLEAAERTGGKIRTDSTKGIASSGAPRIPGREAGHARALQGPGDREGLAPLERGGEEAIRFFFRGLQQGARVSDLLSPVAASHPWGKASRHQRGLGADNASRARHGVAEFGRRGLGKEAAEKLLDPMGAASLPAIPRS